MESRTNDLTEGVLWKKILRYFFPILLGTLFQQLYNTVDAVIVGRFVGTAALAAVGGSAAMILNLVIGFFVGLAAGAMVIISQYFGAQNRERLSESVHTAIAFGLTVGAALTVIGILIAPWALRLVHNPEDIMEESVRYLRIYFAGTIPLLVFNIGSGILRAVGDSKRPLYYLIVCCVLNIQLDLLFVTVFRMGVAGAGWATVAALTVSAALVLRQLVHEDTPYRLDLRRLRMHGTVLGRMLYIGIPSGVQSAMYAISNLILQAAVNDLGTPVVAAWTSVGKLDGIFWSVSNSLGITVLAFTGQAFGAKKYDRMKQCTRVSMGLGLSMSAAFSILLLTLGRPGMRLFTDDPAVIGYATQVIRCFAPFYMIWTFIEVLSHVVRAAGDAIRPMIITIVGICGLRILWSFLVVPAWHTITCISLCYPVSWLVTAAAFVIYYFKSDWLPRCIAKQRA